MDNITLLTIVVWVGLGLHLLLFWDRSNIRLFKENLQKEYDQLKEDYDKSLSEIINMYEIDYASDRQAIDELKNKLKDEISKVKEKDNV